MQMTAEEIYKSWREAKSPKAQIKILAEMNSCSVKDIENAIDQYKKDNPNALPPIVREPAKKPRGKAVVLTPEEKKAMRDMYREGCSIKQISKKVGRSESAVRFSLADLLDKAEVSDNPVQASGENASDDKTNTIDSGLIEIAKALMQRLCGDWRGYEVLVDFSDDTYSVAVNTKNEGVVLNRRVV